MYIYMYKRELFYFHISQRNRYLRDTFSSDSTLFLYYAGIYGMDARPRDFAINDSALPPSFYRITPAVTERGQN